MRQFLAVLSDSYHESLDRKSFWVLLAISFLLIMLCLGTSFETEPVDQIHARQVSQLGWRQMVELERSLPFDDSAD